LDEPDPDILVLQRTDGTFVAAFSARGATKEGIVEAAQADYQALKHELAGEGEARDAHEGSRAALSAGSSSNS